MRVRNTNNPLDTRGKKPLHQNLMHRGFTIGIIIKGCDGILELIGGFLFMLVSPTRLDNTITLLTQHELSREPGDIIANILVRTSRHFTASLQHFIGFYLFAHGIFKLTLVILLLGKKRWAYPFAIIFLVLFMGYQVYRYTYSHSFWLIILTVFDMGMTLLTWIEYKKLGRKAGEVNGYPN